LLQIWVYPNKRNVEPRYEQIILKPEERQDRLQQILSPSPQDEGVWIYQDAWFYLGNFKKEQVIEYSLNRENNGVYLFVIEGKIKTDGISLDKRDGLGIWNTDHINLAIAANSELLLMEVPM